MISLWQSFTRGWMQHFVMQLATLSVLTASFTIVTFVLLLSLNFQRILTQWSGQVEVTAYLKDAVTDSELQEIENQINSSQAVTTIKYVSKKEAARNFSQQLKTYAPDLLNDKELESSFPASFQITLPTGENRVERLTALADQIATIAGVEDVSYGQGWVENYSGFVASLKSVGWGVATILLLGSLFVVGNSIRNSVAQRREEIEILELIGATSSMIRKPYLFEGAMTGALGALLSLLVNYGFYLAQVRLFETSWNFMGLADKVSFLNLFSSLLLIGFGSLLGTLGSYLAVRSLNDGWAASQRVRT